MEKVVAAGQVWNVGSFEKKSAGMCLYPADGKNRRCQQLAENLVCWKLVNVVGWRVRAPIGAGQVEVVDIALRDRWLELDAETALEVSRQSRLKTLLLG